MKFIKLSTMFLFLGLSVVRAQTKSFEPAMVYVEGGTFVMGNKNGELFEKPAHKVTVASFSMGKYEVTQVQWKAVMGKVSTLFELCDSCAMDHVTLYEVWEFIDKLNKLTGKKYRLPTESEWEFAARGGIKSKEYKYSGSNNLNEVSWNGDNSSSKVHPVGQKKSNELGLYDMTGNVDEYCSDVIKKYNPKNFSSGTPFKPTDSIYAIRGSSWYNSDPYCSVAARNASTPNSTFTTGFRLVLSK